jgi:hypothetical protein
MALVVDVEEYCVFKKMQAKLSNGHSETRCPQCRALKALTIMVNNKTLDMIGDVFNHTQPDVTFTAKEVAKHIHGLKTVQ